MLSNLSSALADPITRALGAHAVMRKPFDVAGLLERVASVAYECSTQPQITEIPWVTAELVLAMRGLQSEMPSLDAIGGGIAESAGWQEARRVVLIARDKLGATRIAALGLEAALAQNAFVAASDAQDAYAKATVIRGAAALDFALTDSYCYSLLQFAMVLTRRLLPAAAARVPTGGLP